ncbi:hypothetical protein RRG08_010372 [Elysia crispata]|uniref:Uncharacterized protein n=1 Tax=Elysia crispata TaxID=231223 RepID=A0AAE1BBS9_9GAST|nr:hypothetical protein RRG08_010372 [Elysia crispata]
MKPWPGHCTALETPNINFWAGQSSALWPASRYRHSQEPAGKNVTRNRKHLSGKPRKTWSGAFGKFQFLPGQASCI